MRSPLIIEKLRGLRPERFHLPTANRVMIWAPFVGVAAGIGAIIFQVLKTLITDFFMVRMMGYNQGGPQYEPDVSWLGLGHGTLEFIPWLLLLIPPAGGLIVGLITYYLAPEAAGAGADVAIDSYHSKRGFVRGRLAPVKALATSVTLGTGGSGGAEGPIAVIGASVGSFLAQRLRLTDTERRILLAAGLGAGIGAFFRAPLAGAIFAAEVLYREPDFEAEVLIPAFFSTVTAYCVYCLAFGFGPLFHVNAMVFENPSLLIPLTLLAVAMSGSSLLFITLQHRMAELFAALKMHPVLKPALGGLLTGAVALGLYFLFLKTRTAGEAHDSLAVLSLGYGFLQDVLSEPLNLSLVLLLAVGIGKVFTSTLTIASGGSAGMFGPSMVIGGSLGTAVGLVCHQLAPELAPAHLLPAFAILGMASFFSAAANVPVSTLIMVSELTGSYHMLLPAMWVCGLSYIISQRWTLYRVQVPNRRESPAHRGDFVIDVLEGMTVRDTLSKVNREFITVEVDMPLREMDRLITKTNQICFPVVDDESRYYGVFGLNDIRQHLYDADLALLAVAQDLAYSIKPLTLQMDLSSAMGQFAEGQFEELPVVDENQPEAVIGLLRRQDLIAAYSSQLLAMRSDAPAIDH